MKKIFASLVGILMLAVMGSVALADGSVFFAEDAGVVMRVKNGYTVPVNIVWPGAGAAGQLFTVGIGALTNNPSMIGAGTNATVAQVAASIQACTNAAGKALLTVDYTMSLGADITTNVTLTSTGTEIAAGEWGTALKWDTSGIPGVISRYSAFVPKRSCGGNGEMKKVTKIFGSAGGTGNITLRAYVDQVLVAKKIIVSPVYVWSAITTSTNSNTSDDVSPGELNVDWPLVVGADQTLVIRADRSTTGTTGGLGFSWETLK